LRLRTAHVYNLGRSQPLILSGASGARHPRTCRSCANSSSMRMPNVHVAAALRCSAVGPQTTCSSVTCWSQCARTPSAGGCGNLIRTATGKLRSHLLAPPHEEQRSNEHHRDGQRTESDRTAPGRGQCDARLSRGGSAPGEDGGRCPSGGPRIARGAGGSGGTWSSRTLRCSRRFRCSRSFCSRSSWGTRCFRSSWNGAGHVTEDPTE